MKRWSRQSNLFIPRDIANPDQAAIARQTINQSMKPCTIRSNNMRGILPYYAILTFCLDAEVNYLLKWKSYYIQNQDETTFSTKWPDVMKSHVHSKIGSRLSKLQNCRRVGSTVNLRLHYLRPSEEAEICNQLKTIFQILTSLTRLLFPVFGVDFNQDYVYLFNKQTIWDSQQWRRSTVTR
jgi:hypothetical protein